MLTLSKATFRAAAVRLLATKPTITSHNAHTRVRIIPASPRRHSEPVTTRPPPPNRGSHRAMSAKHPAPPVASDTTTDHESKKPHLASASSDADPPASLAGPPTKSLVDPGSCQFDSTLRRSKLVRKYEVSQTTSVFTFDLPDPNRSLGLSTCACILAKADLPKDREGTDGEETEAVVRPYTPISTNEQIGTFDLLIKNYGENGRMSTHIHSMDVGDSLEFKHIDFNVKIQAPFPQKKIGMIVGGTGITPMIQALHAMLGDKSSPTEEVNVLYGSRVSNDVLGKEMLDRWEKNSDGRLKVTHVLSHEPTKEEGSDWDGKRGFIDKTMVEEFLPAPSMGDDAMVFICGPPIMYDIFCGPRGEKELKGLLNECGYKEDQVYKF